MKCALMLHLYKDATRNMRTYNKNDGNEASNTYEDIKKCAGSILRTEYYKLFREDIDPTALAGEYIDSHCRDCGTGSADETITIGLTDHVFYKVIGGNTGITSPGTYWPGVVKQEPDAL